MANAGKESLRTRVLSEARAVIAEEGLGQPDIRTAGRAARRVETGNPLLVSVQSRPFWCRSRCPGSRAESECAIGIARDAGRLGDSARRLYYGLVDFHLSDLDRFRLIYLAAQFAGVPDQRTHAAAREVHPVTTAMYDAMERPLGGGPAGRRLAVGLHFSALGVATMAALTDTIGDPLKHPPELIARDLGEVFARGIDWSG